MDYRKSGWLHVENYIPEQDVTAIRKLCLEAKNNHKLDFPGTFKGIECASKQYPELWKYYTSEYMFDLAKSLLKTDPYVFNDQVVVKMPNEEFWFKAHYDNQFRPKRYQKHRKGQVKKTDTPYDGIDTVNCSLILDDFTDTNGTLEILNKDTNVWQKIYPKKGDVIAIDGNTFHKSGLNESNEPRCLYACVYAVKPIYFGKFYSEKLVIYDK